MSDLQHENALLKQKIENLQSVINSYKPIYQYMNGVHWVDIPPSTYDKLSDSAKYRYTRVVFQR